MSHDCCSEEGCKRSRLAGSICCKACTQRLAEKRYKATSDGVHRRDKLTDEDYPTVRRMRSEFKSYKDIATHFGVSLPTLRKLIRKHEAAAASAS